MHVVEISRTQVHSHVHRTSRTYLHTQEQSCIRMNTSCVHRPEPTHARTQTKAVLRHFQGSIIQNPSQTSSYSSQDIRFSSKPIVQQNPSIQIAKNTFKPKIKQELENEKEKKKKKTYKFTHGNVVLWSVCQQWRSHQTHGSTLANEMEGISRLDIGGFLVVSTRFCTHNLIFEDNQSDHSCTPKFRIPLHALIHSLYIIKMILRF